LNAIALSIVGLVNHGDTPSVETIDPDDIHLDVRQPFSQRGDTDERRSKKSKRL
jgi:hypothetical protein